MCRFCDTDQGPLLATGFAQKVRGCVFVFNAVWAIADIA